MAKIDADSIRKLRESTGAPVMRAKQILEQEKGDYKKAFAILQKEGFEKAAKREGRETSQGIVKAYTHHSNKIVSVVELFCETDFVARGELFVELAHNIALQVASLPVKDTEDLLKQDFIKDPSKKISDLVTELIAKVGENIKVGRVVRMELGEEK
jgi:elongation factor Ts